MPGRPCGGDWRLLDRTWRLLDGNGKLFDGNLGLFNGVVRPFDAAETLFVGLGGYWRVTIAIMASRLAWDTIWWAGEIF